MEGSPSSSIIELDTTQTTPAKKQKTTPSSTPRRSWRTSKSSSLYSSPFSELQRTPDQKKPVVKSTAFSPSVTAPKTKDSKNGDDLVSEGSSDSLNFGVSLLTKSPSQTIDMLQTSSPSPYKSRRPKYLPKNIKGLKVKHLERRDKLEEIGKINERLLQTVRTVSKKQPSKLNEWTDNTSVSDPLGTGLPRTDVFSPQNFFVTFNELSLDVNNFVSSDSRFANKSTDNIVEGLRSRTLLLSSSAEMRFCCYLLTVTTSRLVYDSILPLLRTHIGRDIFLGWTDLKAILVNFGLTCSLETKQFETVPYHAKQRPQRWNMEFLFFLINKSFSYYKISCLKRLLCLLIDSLFESILLDLHFTIVLLVRRVAKHLLKKGVSVEDISFLINRSYLSSIHNRFIFQYLASDPELILLARDLGIRTICNIVQSTFTCSELTSSQILSLLDEKVDVITKMNLKHVYQLLLICEKLFLLSGSDRDNIEKLTSFAKRVSSCYSFFSSKNLYDTVIRLKALVETTDEVVPVSNV